MENKKKLIPTIDEVTLKRVSIGNEVFLVINKDDIGFFPKYGPVVTTNNDSDSFTLKFEKRDN